MLQFGVVVALLFSLLIAIFAIANNQPITINFLYGKAEVSAIVVILGSAIAGAVVMGILNLVRNVKQGLKIRNLKQERKKLEDQLQKLEEDHKLFKEKQAAAPSPGNDDEALQESDADHVEKSEPQELQELSREPSRSEKEAIDNNKE